MTDTLCVCGHSRQEHPHDACTEPSGRCECPSYNELCPKCSHSYTAHSDAEFRCTRIVQLTKQACRCSHYGPED